MDSKIEIRSMRMEDIGSVSETFAVHGIKKSPGYLSRCWDENVSGERITLLAFYAGGFAGSLHLLSNSLYSYFRERNIPEINDLNVIPPMRKLGIGSALMDAVEQIAFEKYGIVGLGVGLYDSYGSAQRMYARRGYIPDGRGVMYIQKPVVPGSMVCLDDDLNLYYTKQAKRP